MGGGRACWELESQASTQNCWTGSCRFTNPPGGLCALWSVRSKVLEGGQGLPANIWKASGLKGSVYLFCFALKARFRFNYCKAQGKEGSKSLKRRGFGVGLYPKPYQLPASHLVVGAEGTSLNYFSLILMVNKMRVLLLEQLKLL